MLKIVFLLTFAAFGVLVGCAPPKPGSAVKLSPEEVTAVVEYVRNTLQSDHSHH